MSLDIHIHNLINAHEERVIYDQKKDRLNERQVDTYKDMKIER